MIADHFEPVALFAGKRASALLLLLSYPSGETSIDLVLEWFKDCVYMLFFKFHSIAYEREKVSSNAANIGAAYLGSIERVICLPDFVGGEHDRGRLDLSDKIFDLFERKLCPGRLVE